MDARAAEMTRYWENYESFVRDIESERTSALQRIDQMRTLGSFSDEQAQRSAQAIESNYASRMEELRGGATYELLAGEYEAQRSFAEGQFQDQTPAQSMGPGGPARMGAGDRGGRAEEGFTQADLMRGTGAPEDPELVGTWEGGGEGVTAQAPARRFEFPTFNDFWANVASTAATAGPGAGSAGSSVNVPGKMRVGGAEEPVESIGVGETYNWY